LGGGGKWGKKRPSGKKKNLGSNHFFQERNKTRKRQGKGKKKTNVGRGSKIPQEFPRGGFKVGTLKIGGQVHPLKK